MQTHRLIIAVAVSLAAGLTAAPAASSAPGDLDTSFSGDGMQRTDFGGWDQGRAVAIQSDGRVLVTGRAGDNFALARYLPDGTPDISFAGDGKLTTDFGGWDEPKDIAVQPDGRIVVVGVSDLPAPADDVDPAADFALARYLPDGTLDSSFGSDGMQTTDLGGTWDGGEAVVVQDDGRIVVAGSASEWPPDDFGGYVPDDFALARYLPDGSLDTTFSADGTQRTDFDATDDKVAAMAIDDADGAIVVLGRSSGDFAVARYDSHGSLDGGFSGDGKQTTDLGGSGADVAADVAVQRDGKIVAAGYTDRIALGDDFAIARYAADGSLDASFSGDGVQTTDLGGFDDAAALAIQSDGRIVVAGGRSEWAPGDFALVRYLPDGALDASFAGDGMQTTDFGGSDSAADVSLQADGGIVAAGTVGDGHGGDDFAIARYHGQATSTPLAPDTTPPPPPAASPPAGVYPAPQSVALSSEPGVSIHYTTDGHDPTPTDTRYDAATPIEVTRSLTVKAIAIDAAGNSSVLAEHAYTILPSYADEVLATAGVVAYWRLGETAGPTATDATGVNPGLFRDGVTLGRPGALVHDGDASAGFDGIDDHVHVADHATLDTGDRFTLEAWIKRSRTSAGAHTVLSKGSGSYRLAIVDDKIVLTRAGSGQIATATVPITDTTRFHHLVATKSGTTVKLYLDGVERTGKVTNRTVANTSAPLNIARSASGSEHFPGLIDEVAIYRAAITDADVKRHFRASGR